MSLRLQQKLSFQMIQSLKLLQVNTLQLEQLIRTELEMNPVLEAADDLEEEQEPVEEQEEKAEESEDEAEELDVEEDEIDWEEYLDEGFDLGGKVSEESDPNEQHFEPTPVYGVSLDEHLAAQLSEKKISEKIHLLATFIIGCISDDGYLRIPLETIAQETAESIYDIEEALNVIWSMDPAGVGARNLQECLLLQLRRLGMEATLPMRIITETWELFEKIKIPEIARRLAVSNGDIQRAMEVFKKLNPKPGHIVSHEKASVIIPDLLVEKIDGKFIVTLNDRSIPSLHINRAYANMIKRGSKTKKEVKDYVRDKLNGATWLIRSIEQRKNTMLRVMYAIIERQPEFFEKGPPNLSPLKLQDVADMVEMHISTISRVTNGKYVQSPHGIFELKYFFTEGLSSGDAADDDVSSERIKRRIHELIDSENPKKPLSDQKISDLLDKENLVIARRTVAKYREQMKLLPARLRQRYD
jgi:RNA polymerase sigma-54 factor